MQDIGALIQSSSKYVGLRQTLKAIPSKAVRCVVLAEDADKLVRDKIIETARVVGVEIHYFHSMDALGKLCGIEVPCAVVGLK